MEAIKHIFLDNPVATFIAVVMLVYIFRGKTLARHVRLYPNNGRVYRRANYRSK